MLNSKMITQRSLILVLGVTVRTSYRAGKLVLVSHMPGDRSFVDPFLTVLALHLGTIYKQNIVYYHQ